MKKYLILLCMVVMLCMSLSACSGGTDKQTEGNKVLPPSVPETNQKEPKFRIYRTDFFREEKLTLDELRQMKVFQSDSKSDIISVIQKKLDKPLYLNDEGYQVLEYQNYESNLNVVIELKEKDISSFLPCIIRGTAFRFDANVGAEGISENLLGALETDEFQYYIVYYEYKDGYAIKTITEQENGENWYFLKASFDERKERYESFVIRVDDVAEYSGCDCGCGNTDTSDCGDTCSDCADADTECNCSGENCIDCIENGTDCCGNCKDGTCTCSDGICGCKVEQGE